ncbi:MAG: S8 family peptidase, partial [Rhodanobacteraceae bacterium]
MNYTPAAAAPRVATAAERTLGTPLIKSFTFDRLGVVAHVLRVDPARIDAIATQLRSEPGVKSVARVHYRHALSTTALAVNDPYYVGFGAGPPYYEQGLTPTQASLPGQWNMHVINVGQAWGYSQPNSTGITHPQAIDGAPIAILDTGFDLTHPELKGGKVTRAQCYVTFNGTASSGPYVTDYDGHGTDVAGYASGDTNNAIGFASVGFNTPLLLYRVFPTPPNDPNNGCDAKKYANDPRCSLNTVDEVSAIQDAVAHGAKVLSMSFGAAPSGGSCTDATEENAIETAISQGVVVVAASGNESAATLDCPAAYPGVIAVGASALNDSNPNSIFEYTASYSNYDASKPTTWGLVAPGGDPNSTQQSCSQQS